MREQARPEPGDPQDGDDDAWLDLLAGNHRGFAAPSTRREAQAVRDCLLKEEASRAEPAPDVEQGLQRLLFRLRGEGLLDQPASRPRWRSPSFIGAIAAALAIAVAVPLFLSNHDPDDDADEPVMRGRPVVVVPAPAPLAATLRLELSRIGVPLTVTEEDGSLVLEIPAVKGSSRKAAADILKQHGVALPVPKDGLVLELRGPASDQPKGAGSN